MSELYTEFGEMGEHLHLMNNLLVKGFRQITQQFG